MRLLIPTIALLIGSSLPLAAATVEVRTTSGDLITGDVVQETATTIEVKRHVLVKHKPVETTTTLNKSTITTRKEVPSLAAQYETRRAAVQPTLLSQCSLARWCVDRAMTEQALVHTREAEQLDRFSPIVAKLYGDLGYLKVDDQWVEESAHLAASGKVRVGDTVMTKEEAAAAKEKTLKASANASLEQQIRDAEWQLKTGEKKLAEATERRDNAKSELAKAEADAKGAQNRKEQIEKRQQARADRPQNNPRAQNQEREDSANLQQAGADFSRANAAQKKWEKELENAEEALTKVKTQIEKAKTALPDLKKQLEAAGGKPADGEKSEKAGDKPAEKTTDKGDGDKPVADKPKSRFGGD